MKLLVLGGTAFIGRHLVEAAIARGHELTLFTRGLTNPELFPGAEHLIGNRESDLSPLAGRRFDAVIDLCGYVPRVVRSSAELLAGSVNRYVYVSSISVYAEAPRLTETTPVQRAADPESEDVDSSYGPLKALCERAVEAAVPGRALVIRPGLVVGPHDYTGRFSYWPARIARGGEVLAPGRPGTRVWLIDARDLAEWMVRLTEEQATGTFNAAGPDHELTMEALLEQCQALSGSDARMTWVTDSFLLSHGVAPYTELPLWVPSIDGGYPEIEIGKALASGLTFRPVAETIQAVLDEDGGFDALRAAGFGLKRSPAGLLPEREQSLLADWHALHK